MTAPIRWAKRLVSGGATGPIIRFENFDRQPLNREPYDWAFVTGLFARVTPNRWSTPIRAITSRRSKAMTAKRATNTSPAR